MSEQDKEDFKRISELLRTRVRPYVEGNAELCAMLDDSDMYDLYDWTRVKPESGPLAVARRCLRVVFGEEMAVAKERLFNSLPVADCDPVEWRLSHV